jgi:hypothetical protein
MQEPAWATEIIQQVYTEYQRPIPAVNWRQSRKKPYSSGSTWKKTRIAITLGTKGNDHVETLLHELAHYVVGYGGCERKERQMTEKGNEKGNIVHPGHPVPDEVANGLRCIREEELAALARRDEAAKLARPTEEERRSLIEIYESAGQALGLDVTKLRTRLDDIRTSKMGRIRDRVVSQPPKAYDLVPLDYEPGAPDRTDRSFWWARTEWFWPSDFTADLRSDGLHFTGGITHHSGDLRIARFGAVAHFELQADRIPPPTVSDVWISIPHVELFGGIFGRSGNSDITTGDLWSKCWMHRRQTILNGFNFGPSGPVPIVLGQADERQTLIFEENQDRRVDFRMPGFLWMPRVEFSNINRAASLWAELEITFEIQVEGHGSDLWADPEVVLRTFQWPLARPL